MNNHPDGLCCCEIGRECQIYCYNLDKKKEREKRMVAAFPNIQVILDLNLK
jgi:hypothetical protein